jgi:hypothetical protein
MSDRLSPPVDKRHIKPRHNERIVVKVDQVQPCLSPTASKRANDQEKTKGNEKVSTKINRQMPVLKASPRSRKHTLQNRSRTASLISQKTEPKEAQDYMNIISGGNVISQNSIKGKFSDKLVSSSHEGE